MKTVTFDNWDAEVVASETPVLVKFWADWCQPCRMLAPVVKKLASDYDGKVKFAEVNAEDESTIVGRLNISSLPTLMIYKGGKPVQTLVGLQSEKSLRAALDSHL